MTPEMGTTRISIPAGFRGARTESRGDQTSRPQLRLSNCQTVTSAPFPEGVTAPAQYGARICAFVVDLLNYHFLPEDRLAELLSDLFGLKMVPATIARMSAACAQRFRDFADTKLANDGAIRAACRRIWTTRTSSTPSATRSCRPTGFKGFWKD